MRITQDRIEFEGKQIVSWDKVKLIRAINQNLAFILKNRKILELKGVTRNEMDLAFRCFNEYLKSHSKPEKV